MIQHVLLSSLGLKDNIEGEGFQLVILTLVHLNAEKNVQTSAPRSAAGPTTWRNLDNLKQLKLEILYRKKL